MSILLIEAIILIPSYLRQENNLIHDLVDNASSWSQAVALHAAPSSDIETTLIYLLQADKVMGVELRNSDNQHIGSAGEPLTSSIHQTEAQFLIDGTRVEAAVPIDLFGEDHLLRLRIDSSEVATELDNFVLRIAGLVLIISAVMTAATVLAMGVSVLLPLSRLRSAVDTGAVRVGPGGDDSIASRNDEIGDLYRTFGVMVEQLRAHQETLGAAVAQRTKELETAVARLRNSENRFKDFAGASSDFYWEMDRDLRLSFISDRFEQVSGIKSSVFLGRRLQDARLSSDASEEWHQTLEDLAAQRPFRNCVLPHDDDDGNRIYLSISGQPVHDKDGAFVGYRGTGTDVTQRKRTEDALRRNEELLRTIFDNASIGILQQTADGLKRLAANAAFCKLTGYSEQELLEKPGLQITHPDDQPITSARRDRYGRGEISEDIGEFRILHKDGTVRWVNRALTALRDENGVTERYVSFVSDITDRVRAEAELQERERVLRKVLDNLNSGILMVDADLKVEAVNQKMIELFQTPDGLVVPGKSLVPNIRYRAKRGDFGKGDVDRIVEARIAQIKGMANNTIEEHVLPYGTMETRWNVGEDGSRINIATDITHRKADERQLQMAKEEAERVSQSKSDLIATVSHEVRTPMNGVLGMAQLLEESDLDEEQRLLLGTILESGHSLIRIVNDLLDYSKLEAGRFELESEPFIVADVVGQALSVMAGRAKEKGLDLQLDAAADLPEVIIGDQYRLRQIVLNLISNAIRFTEEGSITVRVSSRPSAEDRAILSIAVIDTGCGIKPEEQARLFSPFTQVGVDTARKFGGTGLGLTISRKLVEHMGGAMSLESEFGRGSSFAMTIPFQVDRETDPEAIRNSETEGGLRLLAGADSGRPLRILQIEDNIINQRVAETILNRAGHTVDTVGDGAAGVEALRADTGYDAILMDRDMPVMTGIEATLAIRALPGAESQIPIIGITAGALETELAACLDAGMDTVVTKPVHGRDLVEALRRLTEKNEPTQALRSDISVLVVDDTQINRTVAAQQLRRLGIACTAVDNAAEALRLLEEAEFSAVLSDISMPDMSGEALAGEIRAQGKLSSDGSNLPLVAMTGYATREDRERFLAAGFDDVLTKPVTLNEIGDVMGRLLNASAAPEETKPGATATDPDTDAPVDLQLLEELLGEPAGPDNEWISMFVDLFPPALEGVLAALEARDRDQLHDAAHAAKGAAGSIAATTLTTCLETIEHTSESADWDALEGHANTARSEFERIVQFHNAA